MSTDIPFDLQMLTDLLSDRGPLLKYKWLVLGKGLRLDDESLNSIPKKQGPDFCLGECLSLWFIKSKDDNKPAPLTWESFLTALQHAGEAKIALEIYEKLKSSEKLSGNDDFSQSLKEALKKKCIRTRWTKFTILGPPGSGKTSTIKLLLDEDAIQQHDSTPVAVAAKVREYKIISKDHESCGNKIWRKVETQEVRPCLSDEDQLAKDLSKVSLSQEETDHPKDKILHFILHFVYAVDTGGQAAFLDIAPALLRYNSVSIVTHKLDEDLDAKVKLYYSIQGQQFDPPSQHQLTHRQLLESVIRPSVIQKPELDIIEAKAHSPEGKPSFIVLGTYFDKIDNKESIVLEKSKSLDATLKHFSSDVHIFKYALSKGPSWIFPVYTLDRRDDCEALEVAKVIRRRICESYVEADVPELYFSFHRKLTEKVGVEDKEGETNNTDVIHISECVTIGADLEMSAADVKNALLYYHSLTIILYYPDIIPDYVFLNPQPFFDKLSQIIIASFPEGQRIFQKKGIDLPGNTQPNLSTKGIFSKVLLDKLASYDSDKLHTLDLIALMIELSIIVKLPQEKYDSDEKYFLPSVLPFCDPQVKTREFQQCCNVNPLLIAWDKVMPRGFFCTLVIYLLQHKVFASDSFLSFHPGEKEIEQHHNAIELPCGSTIGGKVMLVDGITRLQVHYTGSSSECFKVQQTLTEIIIEVDKKYAYNLGKPCLRFFSTHKLCVKSDGVSCSSTLNEVMSDLTCNGCHQMYNVNTELERPWLGPFTDISTEKEMDKTPSLNELTKYIPTIQEWRKLGEHLKLDSGELTELEKKNDNSQTELVLAKWRLTASSSRRQVINALRKIGRDDIATKYTDAIKEEATKKQKESYISDEKQGKEPENQTDGSTVGKGNVFKPEDLMKKEAELVHLYKVFGGFELQFDLLGAGLNVDVDGIKYDPANPRECLKLVFQKCKGKNVVVTWEKIVGICEDFPNDFGKVQSNIQNCLSSEKAHTHYSKKPDN